MTSFHLIIKIILPNPPHSALDTLLYCLFVSLNSRSFMTSSFNILRTRHWLTINRIYSLKKKHSRTPTITFIWSSETIVFLFCCAQQALYFLIRGNNFVNILHCGWMKFERAHFKRAGNLILNEPFLATHQGYFCSDRATYLVGLFLNIWYYWTGIVENTIWSLVGLTALLEEHWLFTFCVIQ